jgi:molybdopterin-binding protein
VVPTFRIREAADLIGVSDDTLRRWADGGRVETTTDAAGRLAVDGAELARFARELAESGDRTDGREVVGHSMRNRFSGLVSRVLRDTVMAQVEIQAGPHRFVSLLSREAADELGLEPGVLVVAAIKATNVSVEIPAIR